MAEHLLNAQSALGGYSTTYSDTCLKEIDKLQIVSLAVPENGLADLNTALQLLWNVSFPGAGECLRPNSVAIEEQTVSASLLGLQADQCLVVIENNDNSDDLSDQHAAMRFLQSTLADKAYLTEQSDSLAVLEMQGSLTLPALERICMLDLYQFDSSSVARTLMEHLSVIIEFPAKDCVRLYAPRSMADDFLHAVETSLVHVAP